MMKIQKYRKEFPHVSHGQISLHLLRAKKNPDFNFDKWIAGEEANQVAKINEIQKFEVPVAQKLNKEGVVTEVSIRTSTGPYAARLLECPLSQASEMWGFTKALGEIQRLASGILSDDPVALELANAFEGVEGGHEKIRTVGEQEMLKLAEDAGVQLTIEDLRSDEPITPVMGELWRELNKTSIYLESLGAFTIACRRLDEACLNWLSTRDGIKEIIPLGENLQINTYDIQTSQEVDILCLSAGYGPSRKYWRNEIAKDARIFEMSGQSHYVELLRKNDSLSEPIEWEAIERLTDSQNSDFVLALYYVVGVLAPPASVINPKAIIGGWIDLNDVMEKIGWMAEKPNPAKREILRRQIWDFLVYGEEATVIGRRSIPYYDKQSKQEISTQIESPAWSITDVQRPEQDSLFSETKPPPIRARIVISEQWEPLFRNPDIAQYFPLGELIGAIPPHKVAGDWARLMGLNVMRNWRMKSKETLNGSLKLTRRELLTHYAPKTKSVEEILSSDKPKRAVEAYCKALNILTQCELIAAEGDAAKEMTPTKFLSQYEGYGWGKEWLDGMCNLRPGAKAIIPIREIAANKYEPRLCDLQGKPVKKKGRPKKAQ